jgi:hypothetical protein
VTTTAVDLLDAIRAHLAEFELPELYSVNVTLSLSGPSVTGQLVCQTLPQIAGALLAWADTLTGPAIEAWRVPSGTEVHLLAIGGLPGGIRVAVYGGVAFTGYGIGCALAPDASTSVPLAVLRERATPGEVAL